MDLSLLSFFCLTVLTAIMFPLLTWYNDLRAGADVRERLNVAAYNNDPSNLGYQRVTSAVG